MYKNIIYSLFLFYFLLNICISTLTFIYKKINLLLIYIFILMIIDQFE